MKIDDLLENAERTQYREEQLDENLLRAAATGAAGYFGSLWVGSTVLSALGLFGGGLIVTPLIGAGVAAGGVYGIARGIQWIRGKTPDNKLTVALRTVFNRWKKEQTTDPRVSKAMRLFKNIEEAIVERDEIIAESANVPEEDREFYFMSRRGDIARASQKMQRNARELEDLIMKAGEEALGKDEVQRMRNAERNPFYQDDILMSVRNRDNILEAGAAELGIFREEFTQMMGWIHGATRGELTAIRTK